MKQNLPTFEDIISFESLYRAHKKARLGKRHKKQVVEFELNLSKNLWQLHYDLKYGNYQIGGYNRFMIYDPKEREIQAISYRDRIVQHALCDNFLTPLFETKLIYDNTACRKNKGSHFALKRLAGFMREANKRFGETAYFVKLDISKYFPTIDHSVLKKQLMKIVKDKKIFALCCQVIDSYNFDLNRGLPMGNQSSQNFALVYLNGFDHFVKEKLNVKYYVRYMDDVIMIVQTKKQATEILKFAGEYVSTLNIKLNPKSQIIQLKNGIVFLGWKLHLKNNVCVYKLKKQLKQRIILNTTNSIKNKKNLVDQIVSYNGMLCHGNANAFFLFLKNKFLLNIYKFSN